MATESRYGPKLHQRRSIRLHRYDYRDPGAYFVTLVSCGRVWLFGDIADGRPQLGQDCQTISEISRWMISS